MAGIRKASTRKPVPYATAAEALTFKHNRNRHAATREMWDALNGLAIEFQRLRQEQAPS
jgi:hypothetical protein